MPLVKSPIPSPAYPALKTHHGLRRCVPHVSREAQTRPAAMLPLSCTKFHGQDQGAHAIRKCRLLGVAKGQPNPGTGKFIPQGSSINDDHHSLVS